MPSPCRYVICQNEVKVQSHNHTYVIITTKTSACAKSIQYVQVFCPKMAIYLLSAYWFDVMCRFKYIQYIVHTAVCDFIFATGTSSPLAYSMTLHNEGQTRRTHWAEFASCSSASLPWRERELLLNEMLLITTHHYRPVRSIPFSEPSAVVCFVSWVLHTAGAPGRSWDASFPLQARYNTLKAEVTQCSLQ